MKTTLFCLILIVSSSISNAQWIPQTPPNDIGILLTIDFVNPQNGAAGGWILYEDAYGRAAYTTNAGQNWYMSQYPDSTRSIVTLQFINTQTGFAAGAYNIIRPSFKPSFGRITPVNRIVIKDNLPIINYLSYIERDSVAGTRGYVLKTTNAGQSWFTFGSIPPGIYYLTGMYFVNSTTGFAASSLSNNYYTMSSGLIKTTNGGASWNTLSLQNTVSDLRNLYFIDANTGFAAGYASVPGSHFGVQGAILRTSNGGASWTKQLYYWVNNFTDIDFANSTTGFACGVSNSDSIFSGVVYKTTNAGLNWFKLNFQADTSIFEGIDIISGTGKGFVYGEKLREDSLWPGLFTIMYTVISRTTDYGQSWYNYLIPDDENIVYGSKSLDQDNWFITGGNVFSSALILHTTNGGGPIGIEPISSEVPESFSLYQNYPNPFNPATKIRFSIPSGKAGVKREMSNVKLAVFNILGQEATVLVNEVLKPGTYEVGFDGAKFPSGVYFYRLQTEGFSDTKKMVLMK